MSGKKDINRARQLLDMMDDEFFGDTIANPNRDVSAGESRVHVQRILLDRIRPDPVQPRRILPDEIHRFFHSDRITPVNALREIVRVAKVAARQKGRPFENVLDILGNPEDEDGVPFEDLSPEERLLHELVTLAISIRNDGQVNPITVVEIERNGYPIYRIETGERRYWASWVLYDFIPGYSGDRTIACVVIPPERYSPFRQARENSAREGLSAIAMARQAALLVLTVNGIHLPDQLVDNDFYRQSLDMRIPREYAEMVYTAMGGMGKRRFSQIKSLLKLSDEALELADRHNIEEYKLRPVVQLLPEHHVEIVRQIVAYNLTASQVKDLCEENHTDDEDDVIEIIDEPSMPVPPHVKKLARIACRKDILSHDLMRAYLDEAKGDSITAYVRIRQTLIAYQDALNMLSVSLGETN